MKTATIMLVSMGIFLLVQERQAAISPETFWGKINGNPSRTTNVLKNDLQEALYQHKYINITNESSYDAANRVAGTDKDSENCLCNFNAFNDLASCETDNICCFLKNVK